MITVEYLPGAMNQGADFQSRNVKDSREWKLKPVVFQKLVIGGQPQIWIFLSLECLTKFKFHVVKTRPLQQRQGCFSDLMDSYAVFCFPTFLFDRSGFKESGNRSGNFELNNTNVAGTVLLSITPSNGSEKASSSTKDVQSIDRSILGKSCISRKRKLTTPGMDG